MSLFVAVRPDETAVEHLADAVDGVRRLPGCERLRWQPAGLWHVTLAFLGDPDDTVADEVAERLATVTWPEPVVGARLVGAGHFGRQILWVGLGDEDAQAQLAAVAAAVRRSMRGSGADVDYRPWRPHLTVARARSGDVAAGVRALAGYLGPAWAVGELLLVRSTGGPQPAHQVLAVQPLVPSTAPPPRP